MIHVSCYKVYCKMLGRDGGGWFLAIKSRYNYNQGGRGGFSNSEQNNPEGRLPNWAQEWNDGHITKYSDAVIRNLAGPKVSTRSGAKSRLGHVFCVARSPAPKQLQAQAWEANQLNPLDFPQNQRIPLTNQHLPS